MAPRSQMAQSLARARTPLWKAVRKIEKETFRGKLGEALATAEDLAAENLKRSPYSTIAVAAAAGFVLGGGLTPRMLLAAFWLGGRTAIAAVTKELLVDAVFPQRGTREGHAREREGSARDREALSPRRDT